MLSSCSTKRQFSDVCAQVVSAMFGITYTVRLSIEVFPFRPHRPQTCTLNDTMLSSLRSAASFELPPRPPNRIYTATPDNCSNNNNNVFTGERANRSRRSRGSAIASFIIIAFTDASVAAAAAPAPQRRDRRRRGR